MGGREGEGEGREEEEGEGQGKIKDEEDDMVRVKIVGAITKIYHLKQQQQLFLEVLHSGKRD